MLLPKASIDQKPSIDYMYYVMVGTGPIRRGPFLQQLLTYFLNMMFLSECYGNEHILMNTIMCFSYQILFFMTVFPKRSLC
jgi:hypothetical protein